MQTTRTPRYDRTSSDAYFAPLAPFVPLAPLAPFALSAPVAPELTPSRLLVRVDPERDLADDFVREQRVGRMELACARVAEQAFELALLEHAEAAGQVECAVGDTERRLDDLVLHGDEPQEPVGTDAAFRPVLGDGLDVRAHRFDVHRDLGHAVLDFRVIDHRPRQRNGGLRLQLFDEHFTD